MKVSEADSDLFFKLMWRLQFHVNRKRALIPGIHSVEAYAALPRTEAAFGVLLASAKLARDVAYDPEDPLALRQAERQVRRALSRMLRTVERATSSF